jgi:hypothetical protein
MSKSNRREMIDLFFLDGEVTLQRMLLNLIKTNQGSILSALKNKQQPHDFIIKCLLPEVYRDPLKRLTY